MSYPGDPAREAEAAAIALRVSVVRLAKAKLQTLRTARAARDLASSDGSPNAVVAARERLLQQVQSGFTRGLEPLDLPPELEWSEIEDLIDELSEPDPLPPLEIPPSELGLGHCWSCATGRGSRGLARLDEPRLVPAVTLHQGTALCWECALAGAS